ncbi:spore germination protein [Fictibacillus phosphorivorans]|uniref:spore germination protein n=1 Tax=Fictibacillus phosphorivorans TaxID=1221500 RepID=UPI00203C1535|nr:spore germination protein [Fictibacillus phosphorivorans]MCM3718429.1 spore germination protein [Fictibacillus phosphorivorans]MCM3776053.1 spore germination protein [Fictibacillus phosphorivorans]
MNWFKKSSKKEEHTLPQVLEYLKKSGDFLDFQNPQSPTPYWISYFRSLVDAEIIHRDILPYLNKTTIKKIEELKAALPIENVMVTSDLETIRQMMLSGCVLIRLNEKDQQGVLVKAEMNKVREISIPEEEFSVVGPKESFVESITTNLNLIRKRLPVPELEIREFKLGKLSKTRVAVIYISGIANEENINTALQRVGEIEIHQILDSSYVSQLISDNDNSPFPQLIDTERPDRVAGVLSEGSIVILVDGSPHALIGPTTLVKFFSALEDYFLNWQLASVLRILRLIAVSFSILITPIYVAVLNYHYELIPKDLMATLISSRDFVPLPPFLEALVLELTIELLREAGARLPTKVGQTIGIVGGIVIGTASVEAGLTSNVMLIIVALAALASFTTPVYKMSNAIRLIRFPFLVLAELWGMIGISIAFIFLMGHLLRLTSFGRPYLEPIYPPRLEDLKDAFVRLPFKTQPKRPVQLQSQDTVKFSEKAAKEKKDIDE